MAKNPVTDRKKIQVVATTFDDVDVWVVQLCELDKVWDSVSNDLCIYWQVVNRRSFMLAPRVPRDFIM